MSTSLPSEPPEVPASRAVPPGRIGYDLDADPLLLHSLLSADAYAQLASNGVLRVDPAHFNFPEFRAAYDWMRDQMRRRIPGSSGNYPIWLWAKIRRRDLIDSVRRDTRRHPGSILVTCRIPRNRCLLSHFDDWHHVLNAWPYIDCAEPTTDAELAEYERRLDQAYAEHEARLEQAGLPATAPIEDWPADLRAQCDASWEAILDVTRYPASSCWQACVDTLQATDVTTAVRPVHGNE